MRDRSFENQRYRASGLNLVIAAIVLWNTVYLERVVQHLKDNDQTVNESTQTNIYLHWVGNT
jgi:TnpA family transposase